MRIAGIALAEQIVRAAGFDFHAAQWRSGEEELVDLVGDAGAIIMLGFEPFNAAVIERLSNCRVISAIGIGYNNVDLAAATEHGICLSNNPGYCLEEVSDHTLGLILACSRRILGVFGAVKGGWWFAPDRTTPRHDRNVAVPMFRLSDQTLGLIGFGNIARRVVPKAKAFGMRVVACGPHLEPETARAFGVEAVDMPALLRQADFVSVHARMTGQNKHMLGLTQFRMMKRTAYLINTARGALIDEADLLTALREGYLAGAALDVLEQEPPALDNPLLALENVLVTGHTAAYSEESLQDAFAVPAQEVVRTLRGEWPVNLLNPEVKAVFQRKWR